MKLLAACLTVLITGCPALAATVGFTHRMIPDGANPPLELGIWYPASATPQPTRIGLFTQSLAPDAPVLGHDLPLVVISHGSGGEFTGHNDTAYALAEAGFVVAAPTHTGDNYRDQSRATDIGGRVRQLSATIDFMEKTWQPGAIDPARIGAFGFSAGGLTVLVAAGAEPDLRKIGPHCDAHPTFFDCRLMQAHHISPPQVTANPLPHDTRLRAIVVAAPALGFTLSPDGPKNVRIPVELWRADDDMILPPAFYADAVRAALPLPPDFHTVPQAGHFDFLVPCSPALAKIAPPICGSEPGFDRAGFHAAFNQKVVGFFKRTLAK